MRASPVAVASRPAPRLGASAARRGARRAGRAGRGVLARSALLAVLGATVVIVIATEPVAAQQIIEQDAELTDRPITAVRVRGAEPDDLQLIRNNLRASVGDPYEGRTVRDDVNRIYALGRFSFVTAEAMLTEEGTVEVVYTVVISPPIRAVETVGNKAIPDQDLREVVRQVPGGPRDEYLIERAKRDIKGLYRRKGYYLTEVSIDETELDERGILIFNIIEGPRVRIKAVEFDGAEAFLPKQLSAEIKTRTHVPLLRAGVLDEDVIADDKAALDSFYKARGYLDVRVGHTIALSPDNKEAKVTFHVAEGPFYTLRSVLTENGGRPGEPLELFSDEQIAGLLEIKPGDVYSRDKLRKSIAIVQEAYGLLGRLDVRVQAYELRSGPEPEVDLVISIVEGEPSKVGLIQINGNFLTKDKVIRRLLRLKPGRPYDTTRLRDSERLIQQTRLFNDVRLTIQEPDADDPRYRDLLVEVKERNTGSVNFGLALGSDTGVFGEFSVNQTNFDIADVPESWGELFTGRAFRGAGQRFSMVVRPGTELFQYLISLTEPHILETQYAFNVAGSYRQRLFSGYEEQRVTGRLGLTRQLGDIWSIGYGARAERVQLSDIDLDQPTEVFEDAGPDTLTALSLTLTRSTITTITRPGRGSRLELNFDWIGPAGDFDFYRADLDYSVFLTLDEDFLGRKTTLRLNSRVGYIFNGRAPTYERFYLGGRSFRGFDFREVSPKGIMLNGEPSEEPVGGEWLLFVGAQYEFPILEETITGVLFTDSGTVTENPGLDDYRLSIGAGLRLYIPALGPVPIAFDFGWAIVKEPEDGTRVLSFSAELPF